MNDSEPCLICGRPVFGYEPKYCCDGRECGCHGQPIEPCCCSKECENAVYDFIGLTFELRRIAAGVVLWSTRCHYSLISKP